MEGLAQLVSESMARHGVDCSLDYRRLHWSRWFRCELVSDLRLVPSLPGIFAIAEEVIAPGETAIAGGKRMLAVLQVSAAEDLAIAMTRLLAPQNLNKYGITGGRIFLRYTVVQDDTQRRAAQNVFQRWLTTSSDTASGFMSEPNGMMNDSGTIAVLPSPTLDTQSQPGEPTAATLQTRPATVHPPAPLPSGF
jgi:hypothetical protein